MADAADTADVAQMIIRLERSSTLTEAESSARKWQAARLIWQRLQTGISQRDLSDELRVACEALGHPHRSPFCGFSQTHICWASRAWAITVVNLGLVVEDLSTLPLFRDVYVSDAVRQPNGLRQDKDVPASAGGSRVNDDADTRKDARRSKRQNDDANDDQPHSAAAIVARSNDALFQLYEHRAYWSVLS